jgi:hypothetical protein
VEKPLRSNSPGINSGSSSNLLDEWHWADSMS